jgi:hypothetical protein
MSPASEAYFEQVASCRARLRAPASLFETSAVETTEFLGNKVMFGGINLPAVAADRSREMHIAGSGHRRGFVEKTVC